MKKIGWISISLFVIACDQLSKYVVIKNLTPYEAYAVFPHFNLFLSYNTGAAFSFLASQGYWHFILLSFFSLVMSIILLIWILASKKLSTWNLCSLSLILGGAVGNLIDRFLRDHVIDFLDFYYKNHHFPIFNLADTAITLGAILLLLEMFLVRKAETN